MWLYLKVLVTGKNVREMFFVLILVGNFDLTCLEIESFIGLVFGLTQSTFILEATPKTHLKII